jgi:hypothetical protein
MMDIRNRINPGPGSMTGQAGYRSPGSSCRSAVGLGSITITIGAEFLIIGTASCRKMTRGTLTTMNANYHIKLIAMAGLTPPRTGGKVGGMTGRATGMTESAITGYVLCMIMMDRHPRISRGRVTSQTGGGGVEGICRQSGVTIDTDDSSAKAAGSRCMASRALAAMDIAHHLGCPNS